MNLYISKNGIRLGPYAIEEARKLKAAGQLQDDDWAWYEGLADWIPLQQVPGFGLPPPPPPPALVPVAPLLTSAGKAPRDPALLFKRLATAGVLFIFTFVIFFIVIFFVSFTIGAAISGAQASIAAKAQGFDQGYQVGQVAGRHFREHYTGLIAGYAALAALILSATASFWTAFSGLFPWCQPKRPT
jgi:hypothetical protein